MCVVLVHTDLCTGTFQLMGTIFYVGVEVTDGFSHLVGVVSKHLILSLYSLLL